MTPVEKFIALRATPLFTSLGDAELAILAEKVKERSFAPGAIICEPSAPLKMLYIVVDGEVVSKSGAPAPKVFGAASLLFGLPATRVLTASPDTGAVCLVVRRPHFFTMMRQFPSLYSNLLKIPVALIEVARGERRTP